MSEITLKKFNAPENYKEFSWCEYSLRCNQNRYYLIKNYADYQRFYYPVVQIINPNDLTVIMQTNDLELVNKKIQCMTEREFEKLILELELRKYYLNN